MLLVGLHYLDTGKASSLLAYVTLTSLSLLVDVYRLGTPAGVAASHPPVRANAALGRDGMERGEGGGASSALPFPPFKRGRDGAGCSRRVAAERAALCLCRHFHAAPQRLLPRPLFSPPKVPCPRGPT